MKNKSIKSFISETRNIKPFISIGLAIAIPVASYLIYRYKKRSGHQAIDYDKAYLVTHAKGVTFRVVDQEDVRIVEARQHSGHYTIRMDGVYMGNLQQDDAGVWQASTMELQDYFPIMKNAFEEAVSRWTFAKKLKQRFPEIMETIWKGAETLETIVRKGTGLEGLAAGLRLQGSKMADFGGVVDLIVRRKGEQYFKVVRINR